MAKRKWKAPEKLIETLKEATKTFQKIIGTQTSQEKDYIVLLRSIVDSIENKKKLDILAYDSLTRMYPQIKNIVDQLIKELRIFSIYDDEPHTVNFDYSAYLKQIELLAEIK